MKELSEKELEKYYKELRMTDVPPMWDEIERNLAPKEKREPSEVISENEISSISEKEPPTVQKEADRKRTIPLWRRIPVKQLSAAAAVLVVALLLVSVLGAPGGSSKEDSAGADKSEFSGEKISDDCDTKDMMEEKTSLSADGQREPGMNEQSGLQITVCVRMVEPLPEQPLGDAGQSTDQGFCVIAEVLDGGSSSYLTGDEISIYYYGSDYQEADFTGTMKLQVEEVNKKINLLKILP